MAGCSYCIACMQVQHVIIDLTFLPKLGHKHASPTFRCNIFTVAVLSIQCIKERGPTDAWNDWVHIRANMEGVSPELLRLMFSADEETQVEPISYQAADMWAVGLLLVLMLTGFTPFLDAEVDGKSSKSIADEAERVAFVAKLHKQWVCVWTAVSCAPGCKVLHANAHQVLHATTVCQSQFVCHSCSLVFDSTARLAAPCHVLVLAASAKGSCRHTA